MGKINITIFASELKDAFNSSRDLQIVSYESVELLFENLRSEEAKLFEASTNDYYNSVTIHITLRDLGIKYLYDYNNKYVILKATQNNKRGSRNTVYVVLDKKHLNTSDYLIIQVGKAQQLAYENKVELDAIKYKKDMEDAYDRRIANEKREARIKSDRNSDAAYAQFCWLNN